MTNLSDYSFENISPFVRYAEHIYRPANPNQQLIKTYDHRLFYVISGHATLKVNDMIYSISSGNVLYWISGTSYAFYPQNENVLHMISINFDFTQNTASSTQYLPMVSLQEFNIHNCLEHIHFTDAVVMNDTIYIESLPSILPYLTTMVEEFSAPKLYHNNMLSSLMKIILISVFRAASQRHPTLERGHSFHDIIDYIQGHYAENLDNQKLSELFNYHPNYISQLITEHTGVPLHQYLLKIRINQALYRLQTTNLPISEISRQVGFNSPSYFSHYFKKSTGYSPSAFRP